MLNKKSSLIFGILIIGIFLTGFIGAQSAFNNPAASMGTFSSNVNSMQYTSPSYTDYYSSDQISTYWPILDDMNKSKCQAGTDFLVLIPPAGCTPTVVRSDLLEEQNVPVFCQLSAVRVNPLIKVSSIKSISFKGNYPEGVSGVAFHPARAAVRSYKTLLGDPLMNNVGYVVVVLEQTKAEKDMPKYIEGNLTATIYYDAEKAFGAGQAEFYLPVLSDEQWQADYAKYSFWNGKGYLRLKDSGNGQATIELYTDKDNKFNSVTVKEGATSNEIYFPGFYCQAGLQVKLNKFVSDEDSAKIMVDGDEIWVRKGSKILNNKCTVTSVTVLPDSTGSVSVSCSGNKLLNLVIQKSGAFIETTKNKDSEDNSYNVGEMIDTYKDGTTTKNLFVGYVGTIPENVDSNVGKNFIILVGGNKPELESSDIYQISKAVTDFFNKKGSDVSKIKYADFEKEVKSFSISGLSEEYVLVEGSTLKTTDKADIDALSITFQGLNKESSTKSAFESLNSDTANLLKSYFAEANKSINDLISNYPNDGGTVEKYGEQALYSQIQLARDLGNIRATRDLISIFLETYPKSDLASQVKQISTAMNIVDFGNSAGLVNINNQYSSISLEQLSKLDRSKKKARVSITGTPSINQEYSEGDRIYLGVPADSNYLYIKSIVNNRVDLDYYSKDDKGNWQTKSYTYLTENKELLIENRRVIISDIYIEELAYVSLIPRVDNTKTEANFTFKIGIEKRAIKLSPEKTQDMIDNLNKSIADWEEVNEKLANLIKGWKATCFATSAALMIKNFASGINGESLAREKVMARYKEKCDVAISSKTSVGTGSNAVVPSTRTQCYNALSSDISKEVSDYTSAIKKTNDIIQEIDAKNTTQGDILTGSQVDSDAARKGYAEKVKSLYGSSDGKTIQVNGNSLNVDLLDSDSLRELILLKNSEGLSNYAAVNKSAMSKLDYYFKLSEDSKLVTKISENYKIGDKQIPVYIAQAGQSKILGGNQKFSLADLNSKFSGNTDIKIGDKLVYADIIHSGTTDYLLISGDNSAQLGNYKITGKDSAGKYILEKIDSIPTPDSRSMSIVHGSGSCSNNYKSPKAKFYDNEPSAKLPGIVPFDSTEGWYVFVPQTTGGVFSSGQKGYTAAADPIFFYICNVGSNGVEESKGGDDICQSFDVNTYANVNEFIGCSELRQDKIRTLVNKARSAIKEASQQYGQKTIKISGFQGVINVDVPMGNDNILDCQDFMSPEDCKILFNVCDPVICPSSRCNFGGKWSVSNVVQSGIIGSLVLCLPNFKEGILVPICLTGVNAGIDALISIMKSHRDCLATSLKTGQQVGICDQIYSIYLCEFFWRQIAPAVNIIIPKIIESAYTGGFSARGGGEYMTVMHSWDTMQKSVDYFKSTYATTAFQAFQLKNVEEVGGEFCKAFVGTSLPTSANALDNLLSPESPPQFYAWFSESTFTEATVPATGQYKVYYHIYAGKDKGVNYAIYLKNPPASSYYQINQQVYVKTGYIAVDQSADESIDFTAPSGYKELCVMIDAQENCGFKQVQSDMALNYLKDKYIQQQATEKDITSEKDCISGTPSLYSLASNPNLQAGTENLVNPEISLNGVTRICASDNPNDAIGLKTQATTSQIESSVSGQKTTTTASTAVARWVNVGYCGSSNIRCWLDLNSVKNDIAKVDAIDNTSTLSDLQKIAETNIGKDNSVVWTKEKSGEALNSVRTQVSNLKTNLDKNVKDTNFVQTELDSQLKISVNGESKQLDVYLQELSGLSNNKDAKILESNAERAEAAGLRVQVYQAIVRVLWEKYVAADAKILNDKSASNINAQAPSPITETATTDVSPITRVNLNTGMGDAANFKSYILTKDGTQSHAFILGTTIYSDVRINEVIGKVMNNKIYLGQTSSFSAAQIKSEIGEDLYNSIYLGTLTKTVSGGVITELYITPAQSSK